MEFTQDEPNGVLRISGALDVSAAQELRDALADFLKRHSGMALDLSAAGGCDISALQLLYAARLSAGRAGAPFRIVEIPTVVREAAAAVGLPPEVLQGGDSHGI